MALSNAWMRQLARITLAIVGLALSSATVMAQTSRANPSIAVPAAKPVESRGLNAVNPYAEDAETVAARYRVPETNDVTELMAFIIYLRSFEAHDTQTYLIHRKQMPIAIKAAAEKILRVEKDKTSNAYQQASVLVLVAQIQMLADLTPAQQRELYLQINKRLEVTEPPQGDLQMAMQLATRLELTTNTPLAAEAYTSFAKAFTASSNPEVSEIGKSFVAAARRLNLLGRPMEVAGRTIDGKPFDWKAYQGKVVLVDYWFAGCEPCRRELPNVKRLYQLYHDRGFDVVGINVDDSRDEAEAFVKAEAIPWVTLFDTTAGGDHPMTSYYGVLSFPTVLLVGKDGNVVSLQARGEKLDELLARLLGPAGDNPSGAAKNARTPNGKRGS